MRQEQQAAGRGVPVPTGRQAANGKTLPVAWCPVCGTGIYAVAMRTSDGRPVHVNCYAPALVHADRHARGVA